MTAATLDSPLRSGNRTIITVTVHGKDGGDRKNYSIRESGLIKLFLAVTAVVAAISIGGGELDRWEKRNKADALKPKMEELANKGHDEAALWMMKHYWTSNKQRLAALATKGNPEAMLQQGFIQLESGDKAGGMGWIEKAAAVGNADAIRFIEHTKKE
ncbi:hypothetical protein RBA41_31135 [Massilia sp. CCM 9210]|uniref:hypothetical protein n=1 Tax=Massilia scottii TaxID=3057166 RepID=UPI002796577D|nr:hypothetical protein [Massilia sp. CCM 9210]MDQ1817764.1 hypothetical protein [Massilia sp. CCM 9210]